MGSFGEATAKRYGTTRESQDSFDAESVRRAVRAIAESAFAAELIPIKTNIGKAEISVDHDETRSLVTLRRFPI